MSSPQAAPNPTVRVSDGAVAPGGKVTVPLEVLGASNLRSATVTVTYDHNKLTPTDCTPNRQDFVERPDGLHLDTDAPRQALHIVHMRAWLDAGTDISYEWDFGDGEKRIDTGEVSHVYNPAAPGTTLQRQGDRHQRLLPVGEREPIHRREHRADECPARWIPHSRPAAGRTSPGELTFELVTRNKHGLSGNLLLANLTFTAKTGATGQAQVSPSPIQLMGPGYEKLQYKIDAGGPVYAPTPMRALLDIQPCPQTQAADVSRAALLEGLQRHAVGARRRRHGDPLLLPASGGLLPHRRARDDLGLVDPHTRTPCCPPKSESASASPGWTSCGGNGEHRLSEDYQGKDAGRPKSCRSGITRSGPTCRRSSPWAKRSTSGPRPASPAWRRKWRCRASTTTSRPAPGTTTAKKITLEGAEVQQSLTQLIDPTGELRVPLDLEINGSPGLPTHIKTQRLLFGGGLAIVGTADYEEQLPFSLRSRVLFDDSQGGADLPRLLRRDIARVHQGGSAAAAERHVAIRQDTAAASVFHGSRGPATSLRTHADTDECGKYWLAVNALYWLTLNPRQVDLCRDSHGKLYPGDPEPRYRPERLRFRESGNE